MIVQKEQINSIAITASPYPAKGAPVLIQGTPEDFLSHAQHLGVDGIELHLRSPDDLPASSLETLRSHGFRISAVATGLAFFRDHLSLIDQDPLKRQEAIRRLQDFIDWSSELEASVIIGSMRGNLPADDEARQTHRNTFYNSLLEVADYAEKRSVTVLLECINRYENNYINTARECSKVIDKIGSSALKVHLDTFHMNIEERDMASAILETGDRLGYIHFADNTREACGSGSIDFEAVLTSLESLQYTGWLTIECLPIPTGIEAGLSSLACLQRLGAKK